MQQSPKRFDKIISFHKAKFAWYKIDRDDLKGL